MAEVFDINKEILKPQSKEDNLPQQILKELYKNSNSLTDLLIFTKDTEGTDSLFHTSLDIKDRSYLIQLLQADIAEDLAPTQEITFTPDL